jgi:thiamine biosynthesis lipoprotein
MGVPFRLVLYATNDTHAQTAATAAFQRIAELNTILSDYEETSELCRLSATAGSGQAVKVSGDLWRVLEHAQRLARPSEGAFDVTVGPCVSLWRKARSQRRFPDEARLAKARAATGYPHLVLDHSARTAQLLVPGMRLDLGGIAKGYAVDEALQTLRAHGIRRALVAGSGDIAVSEPPPGKTAWRIELAPLDPPAGAVKPQFICLANQATATSGDAFQYVEINGVRYSHIVDPRTGVGLTDHGQVTVIAPTCMVADALATAVSVLGPERGLRLTEKTPGAAARIIRKPGERLEVHTSRRFERYLERGDASENHLRPVE